MTDNVSTADATTTGSPPAAESEQPQTTHQAPSSQPSQYDLEIDRQVEKYLDLKYSMTIFLITAAIGSLGFTLNFSVEHLDKVTGFPERAVFLSLGSVLGLLTAALLFYALDVDMVSYRRHLRMRTERKSYDQLPPREQKAWDRDINRGKMFRRFALISLFLSIALQAVLLLSFILY